MLPSRFFKGRKGRGPSKFGNRSNKGLDGHTYHSALEAAVANMLFADQRAGLLFVIKRQQHIHIFSHGIKIGEYWPDFVVRDAKSGEIYWVEAKGFEKPDWHWKLNLWRAGGPGRLFIYKGTWRRPHLDEIVMPVSLCAHVDAAQVMGKLI